MKSVANCRTMALAMGLSSALSGAAMAQYLSYDSTNYSDNQSSPIVSLGARWVGQAISLDVNAPTLTLVSVDAGLMASGGGTIPAGGMRLRVKVWGGFDSTASPVFSNLVSEQIIPSTFVSIPGFATIRGHWVFPTPVTVPSRTPVGISIAYEIFNGSDWTMTTAATPILRYGSTGPGLGDSAMPNGTGVYRRVTGTPVTDGNFAPSDYTKGGLTGAPPFSRLYMRVWTVCTGDLTYDESVDDSDFVMFASSYDLLDCADPSMPAGCPSDLNGDHVVDDTDFVIFGAAYDALTCN